MADLTDAKIDGMSPEQLLGPLNDVEQKFAPRVVWATGHREILAADPRVAVVGSRNVSVEGAREARELARFLGDSGVVVVSGLAEGVDTIAHVTAIEGGARTIAVLGTPLDACYPPQNRELQARIGRDHLLVSQFPPGSAVRRNNFPIRNRLMALIADATIIVEASDTSGSLNQGWEALRLGRLLFILDSVVRDPSLTWPAKMIHYGAVALALDRFACVLEELPPPGSRVHAGYSA